MRHDVSVISISFGYNMVYVPSRITCHYRGELGWTIQALLEYLDLLSSYNQSCLLYRAVYLSPSPVGFLDKIIGTPLVAGYIFYLSFCIPG